ncbi:DUF485 domain-containing protein [Polaromonas sp.]|uniref:DUF485 domain-containing protein n=1 Tax=Polaromonas sp. TaxID=1869339 RepID=UPI003751897B
MNSKDPEAMLAARDARYWQEAVDLPSFRELMKAKKKLLVPMVLLYFGAFMGMTLLAGYGGNFMTQKISGAFNMAYLLVLGCYFMCWILGLVYVRIANRDFDAMAARAIEELKNTRRQA